MATSGPVGKEHVFEPSDRTRRLRAQDLADAFRDGRKGDAAVEKGRDCFLVGCVQGGGGGAPRIKVGMPTEVQAALEPLVGALGRELRAFIDFFEHQEDVAVSQVFVSGGSARGELLVQALQLEMLVPCRAWNPAKSFDVLLAPEQAAEFASVSPQLAVAVGAALSAF